MNRPHLVLTVVLALADPGGARAAFLPVDLKPNSTPALALATDRTDRGTPATPNDPSALAIDPTGGLVLPSHSSRRPWEVEPPEPKLAVSDRPAVSASGLLFDKVRRTAEARFDRLSEIDWFAAAETRFDRLVGLHWLLDDDEIPERRANAPRDRPRTTTRYPVGSFQSGPRGAFEGSWNESFASGLGTAGGLQQASARPQPEVVVLITPVETIIVSVVVTLVIAFLSARKGSGAA